VAKRRTGEAIEEINKITGDLSKIAAETLKAGKAALRGAKVSRAKGNKALQQKVIDQLDQTCELMQKAIGQAQSVISGNRHLPDRLVSMHDPEARPISKGKSGKKVQFGRKILLTGNEQGFITSHQTYQGNPNDKTLYQDGVENHNRNVGKKAKKVATDRGFYSSKNENDFVNEGIRVSMPKIGKKNKERLALEKTRWFKELQRFRAGMEAVISNANRRSGLCNPLTRGNSHTECSISWSVLAYNLAQVPVVVKNR
jgi:IS5 family transposase